MRGFENNQEGLFSYVSPEARVPADHPLRAIRVYADEALRRMSRVLNQMYAEGGRLSVPPDTLLKSSLLMALYSVRSERLFCEMLEYNLLFRWFLAMGIDDAAFDHSNFSKNRQRLLEHRVAPRFLGMIVRMARRKGLVSDQYFSVDGTLIDAWASMKSARPKDGGDGGGRRRQSGGRFQGPAAPQRHPCQQHHRSRGATGAQGEGQGKPLGLCRPRADGEPQRSGTGLGRDGAERQCRGQGGRGAARRAEATGCRTRLARRGQGPLPARLRRGSARPRHQAACRADRGRRLPGMDGRTTGSKGYAISQRVRKRIEECFGGLHTIGGTKKVKARGRARVEMSFVLAGCALNLMRIARLAPT